MIEKRADIENTYNKATKQHGLRGMSVCPKCSKPFVLETTNPEKFGAAVCFKCFMGNK